MDELGYVPLAELGAELLFRVVADRAEKAAVIVITNLPFLEWPQVFPTARLCKVMVNSFTDRAHMLEPGTESFRLRRTIASRQKNAACGRATGKVLENRPSASP